MTIDGHPLKKSRPSAKSDATIPSAATVLALALITIPLGCLREPISDDDSPTVDAEIYALGFCSLKCYRLSTECGLMDEANKEACANECIDDALDAFPHEPCWTQWIEARRCRVRETTCDRVEDEELAAGSEACERRELELETCDG